MPVCEKHGCEKIAYRRRDRLSPRMQCRECVAEKNRKPELARLKKQWNARHRQKYLAHRAVEYALKRGRLVKQPCERCGANKTHAHHEDYSKPLNVNWLCGPCHVQRHVEMRTAPANEVRA